ncbi:methyltransferase domain-containing protein [Marinilongibacter aquaticus]|uniref:class I SAM-dependent methyltransferase n=1 Tax=Marinilongibacter aquaticus TaxID=2975157 RepID=UPI0021BDDBF0|nr:class I SAM-dependent methyltransferase [Marinilongibacter aquaticus]UBM57765.1 methyltransferase domain-containing protein [Marinilongibacter aquaticus]
MAQEWNSALYDNEYAFVSKYGEDVLELLQAKSGERILDLGCGTGDLASQIAGQGCKVVGLDSSPQMIEEARRKFPEIDFEVGNAERFRFDEKFDAVFSNATLHWVKDQKAAVACVFEALKPGGRFVAEFGGKGNVESLVHALRLVLESRGYSENAGREIWYFPSIAEYASILEDAGFDFRFATLFDRPTKLAGNEGMSNWLKMFANPILGGLNEKEKNEVLKDTVERLRPSHFKEGDWYADYRRIRFVALKG